MILVDRQIREAASRGELIVEHFEPGSVQPASYDLRIGSRLYSPTAEHPDQPIDLSHNGGAYRLPPYGSALLMTHESLRLPPTMVGRFGLTSGLARRGLLASTGPQVDPGYEGKLFISLLNLTPISHVLKYQDKFLSIEFQTLESPPENLYTGHYQGKYDITSDILEDLVRLEGLNLSQMQSQFTELTRHIQAWSVLASRFDEFLEKMTRHTGAIETLAMRLSERVEDGPQAEARQVGLQEAVQEVLRLFQERRRLFYSDIAEALRLDIGTVIEACEELQRRGLIEGDRHE